MMSNEFNKDTVNSINIKKDKLQENNKFIFFSNKYKIYIIVTTLIFIFLSLYIIFGLNKTTSGSKVECTILV